MSTNTAVDLKKTTKAELAGQLEKEAAEKAALQQQVDQLLEQNRVILEGVDTAAKNHPVIKSRVALEPMDEQIGQDSIIHGLADSAELERPKAQDTENLAFKEKAANLAFNEEMITIQIHDTAEPNAQRIFEVSVNGGLPPRGASQIFERGKQYTVKRFLVETLARAKPTNYRNEEYTDDKGIRNVRWPSQTGLRYPFSVIHDPNPLGPSWLRSVLAQP